MITYGFQRDFETTLTYYSLEETVGKLARTTSLLERTNRELRRKFRQVGVWAASGEPPQGSICRSNGLTPGWPKAPGGKRAKTRSSNYRPNQTLRLGYVIQLVGVTQIFAINIKRL